MQIPEEVAQLVAGSGNSFHAKVARSLLSGGWHVVISPYYLDQTQSKAREIDLVAEKLWPVTDYSGRAVSDVAVRLFVECKFVPSASVFWFTDKNRFAAEELVCASGLFPPNNSYTKKHHYLSQSQRVAKLFTTSGTKGQENDPFYKALNQSLNATVALRGRPVSIPIPAGREHRIAATIEFPVVVCSSFDQLYALDFFAESAPLRVEENFQLEVQYAFIDGHDAKRSEFFLLDFVDFSRLGSYLSCIEEDAKIAAFLARKN